MRPLIVHVGSGVLPVPAGKGGAIERLVWEISQHLSKDSDALIYDIVPGKLKKEIKVARFDNKLLLRLTEFMFGMKVLLDIRSGSRKPAIVHCHTVFTALPFATLKFLVPKGTNLVYTCHNPAWTVNARELDILNCFVRKIEGFVMRRFDYVTAPTEAAKNDIVLRAGLQTQKTVTLYNFVDAKKFASGDRTYLKKKYGIKGPIVLFVGKLNPVKGIETLIRAIPEVRQKVPDVTFVIAGPVSFEHNASDRHWKELVKELGVEDSVIFIGTVDEKELPSVYASAGVFAFPTRREVFGLVLAEAMAAGCPAVSTDIPVVREVTGGNGIFVPRDNTQALAEAITQILTNKSLMAKLSKASAKRSQLFDKGNVLGTYKNFYEKVLK